MIILPTLLAQAEPYVSHETDYGLIFIQWLLPLIPIAFCILLAVFVWRAAKYFGSATKEQILLRIETGKLAEEVHLLRQEIKGDSKRVSSADSA